MTGETNLHTLIKNMKPTLNDGDYVYCVVPDIQKIDINEVVGIFKEEHTFTVILKKGTADALELEYKYIAAWITLTIHSSLEATGLTAAFATALAKAKISCNVVAAYYHDHIFVAKKDAEIALQVLIKLTEQ